MICVLLFLLIVSAALFWITVAAYYNNLISPIVLFIVFVLFLATIDSIVKEIRKILKKKK